MPEAVSGVYAFARFRTKAHNAFCIFSPSLWKGTEWPEPGLNHRLGNVVETGKGMVAEVILQTQKFARMVNVSHPDDALLTYSDNYFDMEAASRRIVRVEAPVHFDPDMLRVNHWLTDWD